jgi:hypothetical protein
MAPLKRFDVSLRTVYAQARELALAQKRVALATPGTVQIEPRGERRFVYRYRYDASGRRITEYLGPEDEEATLAKVTEARAEIEEAESVTEYSRTLRRVGFYAADNSTVVTVASLFNAGIFAGGGILVGTHAFGALLNELGVHLSPFPMTDDVDLARGGPIEIAALPKGGLLALLRETGLPFHEVPQLRRRAAATSFKVRGTKLKVDLLVPARGKAYEEVAVPELGAHATGLPHFSYLLDHPMESMLLGRDRIVPIVIPHPGRYCLHKLAVYSLRSDPAKREKDLSQAALLAAVLAEDQDFLLAEAMDAMDRALRSKVKAGAKRVLPLLETTSPTAAQQLQPLL